MFRPLLPLAGLFACALTLAPAWPKNPAAPQPRPVMVVHPQPASEAMVSYAGEVRARYEPELAFRIGGKIVERLVEVGEHVRENQPLARLDPQDVRLQLDGVQAQVAAAEATCGSPAPSASATGRCSTGSWPAARSTTVRTISTAPPRRG